MAFPMVQFKATNLELEGALQDLVEQKLHTLEKYLEEGQDLKCEVEFEKVTAQQSGNIHRIEVNLYRDGTMFRAEATEDSFEKAADEVRNELDKEMRRAGKKQETMFKRGGRAIKDMLKFGGE
tara:strand:+ start:1742 stop:2110 length:369 start_codon:yes stop_codon:yes gene_type:complete